jgi:hypothetical protein
MTTMNDLGATQSNCHGEAAMRSRCSGRQGKSAWATGRCTTSRSCGTVMARELSVVPLDRARGRHQRCHATEGLTPRGTEDHQEGNRPWSREVVQMTDKIPSNGRRSRADEAGGLPPHHLHVLRSPAAMPGVRP